MTVSIWKCVFSATVLATAAPAEAEWLKATSRHFIVYADTDEKSLRRQATELERLDAVIRRYHPAPDDESEFNRLTVYVVPDVGAVEKLVRQKNVAGFYVPRVTGSVAFTPKAGGEGGAYALTPRIVLFHEYAHHFLLGNFANVYPAWFSEGFAEYASTVMERSGEVWLGAAANHRGYALVSGKPLSIRQLFEPPAKMNDEQREAIYSRGWLLTHFLQFDAEGQKQLGQYLRLLNTGKPSLAAATAAFGELKLLDAKLDKYLVRSRLPAIRIDPANLSIAPVTIQPMTPGEGALISFRMTSTRGVDAKTAGPLYARARTAAAAHGKDAVAQGWLAEMAYDAGEHDAAEAAADAALAVDPKSSQALLYKARVHLARANKAKAAAPAWTAARGWIIKANRASNNDAAALALYYESFRMEGSDPTKAAIAGLYRALELVPQDPSLRMMAAAQRVLDGDKEEAQRLLRTIAFDPHAGADHPAKKLLAALDAGRTGAAPLEGIGKAEGAGD